MSSFPLPIFFYHLPSRPNPAWTAGDAQKDVQLYHSGGDVAELSDLVLPARESHGVFT